MPCSECGSPTIEFAVPNRHREYLASNTAVASCCTRCLTVEPVTDADADADADAADSEFDLLSDAVPGAAEKAVPLLLALDLAESLVTNRAAIESLLCDVERAGADPLLAIDRLERDPDLEPAVDLERRSHQIEQLLY
ncbi:DUF6276 family protein [Natronobacterium gregoryi]|uniref:Small CPxCG-related zinc finger protein n=2 Tax=Natronobacterium gregoryi TaxID=44930 RepID=L0AH93_NATGS|nr:DUF6276 family protein [Natronobacterium gregoryi]AFZ73156.1 hypothetical protein Natgr_1973 [Natronobacterium gregoryi SP2]ELY71118.1 hypothetical protein C490_05632 [Natronobacterium gregoryi SP2]PLK21567.1 hypothetical protein CYV19_03125 [Natronobacterium gregoryi SP2]SFI59976.1 hypothetical protein SAMN05443661_102108 [Natronobacterium gregoryi]